ncbi:ligand-binding sensor domain-containing protein [Emticicia fluvialis]|uniref:ligand-binding sensor domain-containing protein n=1 Tax=Emticicia fluvialis TaxID=2974474 RepID=UPI002165F34B|nr:two-component regulator propeller domain-containing protein [Emticicia fluvialis]
MTKFLHLYLLLMLVSGTLCKAQIRSDLFIVNSNIETKEILTSNVPSTINRTIKQDKKGNIWFAAFDGVYRYDGKSFTNIIKDVSSARFFSVTEDRKGNFWFTSIGSGVYYYNPSAGEKSFRNFTTKDGLVNDSVPYSYEDKRGNMWFGTLGGASRYDGKAFQNYKPNGGLPNANKDDNDVNAIIEDKTGKFWFGTRGNAYVYDGKKFTVLTNNGETFTNVRSIIEDKKGNIWLGGKDGLWRYDPSGALRAGGKVFTNFTKDFVGFIYEDKNGNIWTSAQNGYTRRWELARYEAKSLSNQKPTVSKINPEFEANTGMIFGILEAHDGSIWFGALDGVRRFDGKVITHFKNKK